MSRLVRSDAPRPWSLFAIAGVAGLVGYGVAHASLDVDRAALAARQGATSTRSTGAELAVEPEGDLPATELAAAGVVPAATAGVVDAGANDAPDAGNDRLVEATASAAPAAPVAPEPPVAPSGGSSRVEMGRVAYIRCDGLPSPSEVCPRDLGVERRVWEAVQTLATCPAARGLVGDADLRVVFDGGRFSGIGFRDFDHEALDTDAVRGCLEGRLRELRTAHPATRYTASFRFSLVR